VRERREREGRGEGEERGRGGKGGREGRECKGVPSLHALQLFGVLLAQDSVDIFVDSLWAQ
jgi:hypothetical protein